MPHINRLRLVNVNFNDAKGIYDNFMMRLDGKSTTYDLMNTGGKSLLLLMLLQTVIPNTYLKKEKPVKNIFAGGNSRRTSHCLVEWILDEGYQYKYMLTGFCARKKQDIGDEENNSEDKLEIDYYNYCYFYNDENRYDIKYMPLVEKENGENTYMSYDKLRQLFANMRKEDLPIKVFDSKKEYMKYISYYGLIPAEWKLISEINVSENYIEKYFKENKTSRKLIENFLIKIIDDVNMQNNEEEKQENQLADTLIELKDNLTEFRKKSDNKNEFIQVREMYNNLNEKNEMLKEEFSKIDKIDKKAYEALVFNKEKEDKLKSKIQNESDKIEELKKENILIERTLGKLEIDKLYYKQDELNKKIHDLDSEKTKVEEKYEGEKRRRELAKAQNEYVEYSKNKEDIEQIKLKIENLNLNEDEVKQKYELYGYNYKLALKEKLEQIGKEYKEKQEIKGQKEEAKKIAKRQENQARDTLSLLSSKIETLENEMANKQDNIDIITNELTEEGDLRLLLNVDDSIEKSKEDLNKIKEEIEQNKEQIEKLQKEEVDKKVELEKVKSSGRLWDERLKLAKEKVQEYEEEKNSLEKLVKTFQVENIQKLEDKLRNELQAEEKNRSIKQIEKQMKTKKLELIEKYNMVIPNEDIFALKQKLEDKCNYIVTGIEELKKIEENKRKEVLDKNPLLIYSIFIDDETFRKIKNKGLDIELENLVPIISIEMLRKEWTYEEKDIIFPIQKSIYQNMETEKIEQYKVTLNKDIFLLEEKIEKHNEKEENLRKYLDEIKSFNETYSEEFVKSIYKNKTDIEKHIKENENKIKEINNSIQDGKEKLEKLEKLLEKQNDKYELLSQKIKKLEELDKLQNEMKELKSKKELAQKDYEAQKENLQEKEEAVTTIENALEEIKNKIRELGMLKENFEKTYTNLPEFKQTDVSNEDFEILKNHFEAYDSQMKNSNQELNGLQEMIKIRTEMMEKCQKTIKENNCTIEYFSSKNESFSKVPDTILEELNSKIDALEKEFNRVNDSLTEKEREKQQLLGQITLLVEKLQKEKNETYLEETRITELNIIDKKIEENNIKLRLNKKQIKELSSKIENVEEEVKRLDKEFMMLDSFVKENEIEGFNVDAENLLENEVFTYKRILEERKKINKVVNKLTTDFSEYINYIKEQVSEFYIKQDVLDKIENLKIPTKLSETTIISNGITTIIETLEEKIRHIEEALKLLESYQENFITKCFEKAETIVRDLEKLPGLSRIKINGKDTNIIKLDLFEYEKEEKLNKMKEYIYDLVKETEENPDKMNKEQLNESLSSKALVSQIVNMDKASVKLYKIEDIPENSTYKKWEDDLGSDGQVNAIYFMFAVCIISYISMLTRKENSNKSKKVIIADNPFGATSAVFLWNVMFSILKENNVQLIAPGHNINKEIVSKFEVNYVLKHEYYNGNKKSVVVDKELRTEDDIDNMNFEILQGDQQSIF